MTLTWAGATQAAVLYSESGAVDSNGGSYDVDIFAGAYRYGPVFKVSFDYLADQAAGAGRLTTVSTRYRIQPDGWPDALFDTGDLFDLTGPGTGLGGQLQWETTPTGFTAIIRRPADPCADWTPGQTCNYTNLTRMSFRLDGGPGEMKYSFTISSVPEPATWAMMIIGFGAVGTMARSHRRRATALA